MQNCTVYSLSRLGSFLLRRSSFLTGFYSLLQFSYWISQFKLLFKHSPSSPVTLLQLFARQSSHPFKQHPQNRNHLPVGQPELLRGYRYKNSFVRTEVSITTPEWPFSQGDASPPSPPGILGCLPATSLQPDAFERQSSLLSLPSPIRC